MTEVRSADGTRLALRVRGEGSPVVLVHGTSGSAGDWGPVARLLSPAFRTVRYDRRGRGASGDGPAYAVERELEDLHAVLDWAGERCHLVGHSFGARLALEVATARGDLRSLTLYEPPLDLSVLPASYDDELAAATREQDWERVLAAFQPVAGMPADEVATLRSVPAVWQASLDGARTVLREHAALRARGPVLLSAAQRVAAPSQVLVGALTDSALFLSGLDELAGALRAPVHRIAGQRHLAMVDVPRVVADAVTGLAGRTG